MATMHKVEIVIHVDDVLGEEQQAELIDDLRKHGRVAEAHLMATACLDSALAQLAPSGITPGIWTGGDPSTNNPF